MKKKYYILVLTLLSLFVGQSSYAIGQGDCDDCWQGDFDGDLKEVIIIKEKPVDVDINYPNHPVEVQDPNPGRDNEDDNSAISSTDPATSDPTVENKVEDPCMKDVVDKILNTLAKRDENNTFTKILNDPFFKQEYTNLTIKQYSDDTGGPYGINTDGVTKTPNIHQMSINLNFAALDNASNEYIAATIYHELIHVSLNIQGITGNDSQHETMAQDYRDDMSNQLQADFPDLSKEDADALAWGGLSTSNDWAKIINSDIINNTGITGNINAINTNFKNLNNSTNGEYGTPCDK